MIVVGLIIGLLIAIFYYNLCQKNNQHSRLAETSSLIEIKVSEPTYLSGLTLYFLLLYITKWLAILKFQL